MQDHLPPPVTRWVAQRKADVIIAIRNGLLSLEEARDRYTLTTEELISWQVAYNRHGLNGLKVARLHTYRDRPKKPVLIRESACGR